MVSMRAFLMAIAVDAILTCFARQVHLRWRDVHRRVHVEALAVVAFVVVMLAAAASRRLCHALEHRVALAINLVFWEWMTINKIATPCSLVIHEPKDPESMAADHRLVPLQPHATLWLEVSSMPRKIRPRAVGLSIAPMKTTTSRTAGWTPQTTTLSQRRLAQRGRPRRSTWTSSRNGPCAP